MSNQRKKHPIRNALMTIVVVVVVFLASLFGNIFPGLNDFRDTLLENQAYSEVVNKTPENVVTSAKEIMISEDTIYYLGEKISIDGLIIALDNADVQTITLVDYQGTAKQTTWASVKTIVEEKGFAITEKVQN